MRTGLGPGLWDREQAYPYCMLTVACAGRVDLQMDTCNTMDMMGGWEQGKGPRLSCEGQERLGEVTSTGHGGVGQEEKRQGECCRQWALRGAMGALWRGRWMLLGWLHRAASQAWRLGGPFIHLDPEKGPETDSLLS